MELIKGSFQESMSKLKVVNRFEKDSSEWEAFYAIPEKITINTKLFSLNPVLHYAIFLATCLVMAL